MNESQEAILSAVKEANRLLSEVGTEKLLIELVELIKENNGLLTDICSHFSIPEYR